ncbi:MAG: GNAT family N-acetyltransferase [Candidatus Riflebacteria bacterium]|nr:GNAT family N-acetyltransferase [Candidatus Riflebacteria bacterium]
MSKLQTKAFQYDSWLSQYFESAVYRLNCGNIDDSVISEFYEITRNSAFIYAKVASDEVIKTAKLEELGFRLVETNIQLEKILIDSQTSGCSLLNASESDNCRVRFAEESDKEDVCLIAAESFIQSRFFKDPNISPEIAKKVKSGWAENYFSGKRGDYMVVACCHEKVSGFMQLIRSGENLIIDLVAVDKVCRGKSLGRKMINFAENKIENISTIKVGTQLCNTGSLNFYQKCGFIVTGGSNVFHYFSK